MLIPFCYGNQKTHTKRKAYTCRNTCARDTKGQFFFGDASFIAKKNRSEAQQKSGGLLSEVVRKRSGTRQLSGQKINKEKTSYIN